MAIQQARKVSNVLLVLFFFILLTGCGLFNSEKNWEDGRGKLPEQIKSPDAVGEGFSAPPYDYFVNAQNFIDKTDFLPSTGEWFGAGKFGYGLSLGTMKAGEDYVVSLIGHDVAGVPVDRDVRIQLTKRDHNFKQSELIKEEIIHVDTITNEEEIYLSQLPNEENVVYVLSAEILNEQDEVEDTMASTIYIPTPEINAKLTTDKDVYGSSDEQATIILENFGPTFLSLGKDYHIEKKIADEWKVVPLDHAFEDIGVNLNPENAYDQKMDIDELTPGQYRVIKDFGTDGLDLTATLATEFTVE